MRCTVSAKNNDRAQPEVLVDVPTTTRKCEQCKDTLTDKANPLTCGKCKKDFHKTKIECTGMSRWRVEKIIKEGKEWRCKGCRNERVPIPEPDPPDPPQPNDDNNQVKPGKCQHSECGNQIRKGVDFLICTGCKSHFHKRERCSQMTRKQVENLNRSTWTCLTCQEKVANPRQKADEEATESDVRIRKTKVAKLKVLQFNADALLSKLEELKVLLKERKIDVFLIQETKLITKDKLPKIPGYTIPPRQDRVQLVGNEKNRGGGLLIGIKNDCPFKEIHIEIREDPDTFTEWMSIEIPTTVKKKIRLTNIYIPPSNTVVEDSISPEKWPCKEGDIILGDVNAHSPLWDDNVKDGKADRRGEKIESWLAEHDMACVNNGKPTHVHRTSGKESAPDISFVHSSLLDKITWETVNDLGSDHKPIILTYEDEMIKVNNKPRFKWRMKDADWESFKNDIEQDIPSKYHTKDVNKLEKKFRKLITNAANKNIGKKKISNNTKPWMTTKIKESIKVRNELRKTVQQNRGEWIQACRNTADLISNRKKETWKEYVESISATSSSAQIWKTIRSMDGRRPPERGNEILEVDGVSYVEDKDKAKQFAKTYKSFSKLPVCKEDRIIRRYVRKRMKRRPTVPEESEQDITMVELERAIDQSKKNKASGEDDIPYEFLKNLGPKAKELLLFLYNKCWEGNGIPVKWRTAIIKPLLKDGKDPKETVSYRPISLTCCMGKILEKIIADRLIHILEERNLINDNQAGFRPNRCTTDQVLKLVQQASDQLHNKGGDTRLLATFFDYEKAYDKVWRDGLMYKMEKLNIPTRFIRYVRHFLSGRKTRVDVNGSKSDPFRLDEGLPQGSSISPLLFLIFINDIDVDLDADTTASLFADDTATWMKDGRIKGSNRVLMQQEINKIMDWATTWKMKVNEDKTRAMVFSTSTNDLKWDPKFEAGSQVVKTVKENKFLGITVDNSLRFPTHISNVSTKCKKRINIIRCLSNKDWGNCLETQRTLYIQYIRAVMEYASSSWTPWISKTNLLVLQRLQNQALRSIAGLYKDCPVDFLHLETGIEPLINRYEKIDDILWDKYQRLPEHDQRKQLVTAKAPTRLKTRLGWRKQATERMEKLDIKRDVTTGHLPPWRQFNNLTIDKVPLNKPKEEYTEEELYTTSMQKIRTIESDVRIFTDGSTGGDQTKGGAGVYIESSSSGRILHQASYPAGKMCSSYTGECVAFLEALKWLLDNPQTSLICTDSLSLQEALLSNDWKDKDPWLKLIKENIYSNPSQLTLLWIPSHCGIEGNEAADRLANEGAKMCQDNVSVTHEIVKAKIKSRKWEVTHDRAKATFEDRRKPKVKFERKWPRSVRSLYARLRTGHAMELRAYQHRLDEDVDPMCEICGEEEETIEHILCRCPADELFRRANYDGEVKIGNMTSDPNLCRRILERRFPALELPDEEE